MKKTILSIMIAGATLLATNANAQLQKGTLMVGGDLANLNIGLRKDYTDISFSLSPKLGYFIKDNIAVGGYVDLGFEHESVSKIYTNTINYGIGAFGRYYVSDPRAILLKHTRFFAEANVGISGYNSKPEGGSSSTTNGLGLGIGPGVAYFITPNIGLEALLKYDLGVGFGNSTTSHNFSINVGFQIYLPTKQARALYNDVKDEVKEKTDSED